MSKINPCFSCYLKFINISTFGKFHQRKLNFSYLILKTTYQGLSKYWSLPLLFLLHSYSLLFWSKSFLHFYFTSFLTLVIFAMFAKPVNNTQKKNLTCEMNKTVFSFSYDKDSPSRRAAWKSGKESAKTSECQFLIFTGCFQIFCIGVFLYYFYFTPLKSL